MRFFNFLFATGNVCAFLLRGVLGALLLVCTADALAFTCRDATGNTLNSVAVTGSANVYVNLQPSIAPGQNLVVDLSNSVFCKNDTPSIRNDLVSLRQGSSYNGVLNNFRGSVRYYGASYPFPLSSPTGSHNFTSGDYQGWQATLYLTPVSSAGGVVVNRGTLFASLVMHQVGSNIIGGGNVHTATFTWNLYANNNVVVPTGGCDVSARNVTVTLPEYPGTQGVPLTVRCAQNQRLGYFLSGSTTDGGRTIFTNTASNGAKGVGVQLIRNGTPLATNNTVSLGNVGTSSVSLGLSAAYARTSGQVVAGNVQSVIGVTFVYQ